MKKTHMRGITDRRLKSVLDGHQFALSWFITAGLALGAWLLLLTVAVIYLVAR